MNYLGFQQSRSQHCSLWPQPYYNTRKEKISLIVLAIKIKSKCSKKNHHLCVDYNNQLFVYN